VNSKANHSGTSTPFVESGSSTPQSDNDTLVGVTQELPSQVLGSENGKRRLSHGKTFLAAPDTRQESRNDSQKEHSEQGQVKLDVYMQYIKAASTRGFVFFVLAMIGQQAMALLGNLTLRDWGEQNRRTNQNSVSYVLLFGLFTLSSTALGGAAGVALLVFCTLKSTKHLHDSVRLLGSLLT